MQHLNETLTQISILNAQTALNLQVFPLIAAATSSGLDYLTMAEAVAAGTASVEETSLSGSVPEIQLRNGAEKPILILDGEELIGAKQNRTVNITILAPAGKTTSIPVTCIEAGRWSSGDLNFEVAPRVHYSRGRAMKMASVSESLAFCESRAADQSDVWDQIAQKSDRMRVRSATSALSDVFESHSASVEDYVRRLRIEPDQIGAIFAIDGIIEGLELFDASTTFSKMFENLIRSYALDALETANRPSVVVSKSDAQSFLEDLAEADTQEYTAIGLGQEIRINTDTLVAGGLRVDQTLVHLVAFRKQQRSGSPRQSRSEMLRASMRRRNRESQ
jgi:hypothetical protein